MKKNGFKNDLNYGNLRIGLRSQLTGGSLSQTQLMLSGSLESTNQVPGESGISSCTRYLLIIHDSSVSYVDGSLHGRGSPLRS